MFISSIRNDTWVAVKLNLQETSAEGKTGSRNQGAEPDMHFRRTLDGLSGSNVEAGFKGD